MEVIAWNEFHTFQIKRFKLDFFKCKILDKLNNL